MKAKKPLLVLVLTLALIAVALILPAAAYGKGHASEPVSWVAVGTNCWLPDSNFPDLKFHGGTEAKVQKFADGSLRGQVVVKVFREFWALDSEHPEDPTLFRYVVKTSDFTSPDWWDYPSPENPFYPGLAHSDFFFATADNCPADLGIPPDLWSAYKGAAVADFVAYIPVSQYPESLPWLAFYRPPVAPEEAPSIPLRFMFIDGGKSGKTDVMLNWLFVGFPGFPWMPTVWTVPIQSGNIQVHVGATDG